MKTAKTFDAPTEIDPKWRIGIVYAPYYKEETESMVNTAKEMLFTAGIEKDHVTLHVAPGSWEIPLIGRALVTAGKVDALIGFGIIVQGDTKHAEMLADGVVQGMMDVQVRFGVPFAIEVLYVNDIKQARDHALGEHNKGKEAAAAVLQTLVALKRATEPEKKGNVGFRVA